jgi:hypothetical protein
MLKMTAGYDRDTSTEKFTDILVKVLPASLLGGSAGICQRALVDESECLEV